MWPRHIQTSRVGINKGIPSAVKMYNFPAHKGFCVINFLQKCGIITHAKMRKKKRVFQNFVKFYQVHLFLFLKGPLLKSIALVLNIMDKKKIKHILPTSYFVLPFFFFPDFLLPTSYFLHSFILHPTSYFLLPTLYFLLPTSYFFHIFSYFPITFLQALDTCLVMFQTS